MSQIDVLLENWRKAMKTEYPWLTEDDITVVVEEFLSLAVSATTQGGQPAVVIPQNGSLEVWTLSVGPRGTKPTIQRAS
jgi:hypothetical protein